MVSESDPLTSISIKEKLDIAKSPAEVLGLYGDYIIHRTGSETDLDRAMVQERVGITLASFGNSEVISATFFQMASDTRNAILLATASSRR